MAGGYELARIEEYAALLRRRDADFARWAAGYGVIKHTAETQVRVHDVRERLALRDEGGDGALFYTLMMALDRLTSAALWLIVHMTYANKVYLDGRDLKEQDFKPDPQGHTGGSLNMAPGYAAYLALNAATGFTRAWLMGQGHCVAAIDSLNVLVNNMTAAHAARYDVSEAGLTRLVQDFYSYRVRADGDPDSPLGSHVNVHTAGGMLEGGFLGFAELLYPHMPLPGERLTVFLSDGAFEEQRGSDWAPRWWRAEDSGIVTPIMINNGRRIDQRTIPAQEGGTEWFVQHLRLNGFDPIVFDGRDPAAFLWAMWEMEERLSANACALGRADCRYPAPLPYGIAVAPKGAGFYGEGTNAAHNLPLGANPRTDPQARVNFNEAARNLWVPFSELQETLELFQRHKNRPRERDHPIAHRDVSLRTISTPQWQPVTPQRAQPENWTTSTCAMSAIDEGFVRVMQDNPHLRARMGNPDESRSNHMYKTLDALKHRVTDPEHGNDESITGGVITALNEEAVVCAALGNKGGINIVVTYEAFAVKMQSALRQEIIFANHARAAGRPPRWLAVPVVLTSHTWENGKNEQSHQDPSLCEALMNEPADVSRVLFPVDYNSAAAVIADAYQSHGEIWTLVAPKGDTPVLFTADEARQLLNDGASVLRWTGHQGDQAHLALSAVGSYQLLEILKASARLRARNIPHRVIYLLEPARLRQPRNEREARHVLSESAHAALYGGIERHVLITHTHPEILLGLLHGLHAAMQTRALGYINHGGTYSTSGLLFANRCAWAHAVQAAAQLLDTPRETLLSAEEIDALDGKRAPHGIIFG